MKSLKRVRFLGLAFDNEWQEPLNGFTPKSHGRCVWSLARMSLNVKVAGNKQHTVHSEHPRSVDGMELPRYR